VRDRPLFLAVSPNYPPLGGEKSALARRDKNSRKEATAMADIRVELNAIKECQDVALRSALIKALREECEKKIAEDREEYEGHHTTTRASRWSGRTGPRPCSTSRTGP
jgi:hypothetical protein